MDINSQFTKEILIKLYKQLILVNKSVETWIWIDERTIKSVTNFKSE